MPSNFRDFIPEGEDNGAITATGYQDFVPEVETVTTVTATEIHIKQQAVGKELVCPDCGFEAKARIGLAGHMRKHK